MSTVPVSRAKAHFSRIFCDYFGNNRILQRFSFEIERGQGTSKFLMEIWIEVEFRRAIEPFLFRDFAISRLKIKITKFGTAAGTAFCLLQFRLPLLGDLRD